MTNERTVGGLTAVRMVNRGYDPVEENQKGNPVKLRSPDGREVVHVDYGMVN